MEIELRNISKIIKGTQVLDHISLSMSGGKIYGLRGKNGSGKTMLMRTVCGLVLPTKGECVIDGKVIGKDVSFPNSVGALIENPAFLPSLTGYENLKLIASIRNIVTEAEICEAMSAMGLDPKDNRAYKKYSLGMKQRLGLAGAVMGKPHLIILDEPINAIDEEGVRPICEYIHSLRDPNRIIIVACHDSDELNQLSDVIVSLDAGRIKCIESIGEL